MLAIPQVSHGSGLAITADGLILTARHVVADADVLAVLLPGQERALAATVVASDPDHDVAFVRVRGPLRDFLPLPAAPVPVQALQRVSASGYPLEARERTPAATSGEVSRVNDDGRIQLAIGLNPGNSGGARHRRAGAASGGGQPGGRPRPGGPGGGADRAVAGGARRVPAASGDDAARG
jgi:S1-C subfamily serine protease